jgi:hypothetical protein
LNVFRERNNKNGKYFRSFNKNLKCLFLDRFALNSEPSILFQYVMTQWYLHNRSNIVTRPLADLALQLGKVVPLQAWSGSEGSRKLRFPDFMTTAQDGDQVVSLTHRTPVPPGNTPGTHFC